MKLPRNKTGGAIVKLLIKLGFEKVKQTGSHVQLIYPPTSEKITVPNHNPIKPGTLSAILESVIEITGKDLEELLELL